MIQNEGNTVYVPAGFVHTVRTLSNGGILIGETMITPASLTAYTENLTLMVAGAQDLRENPESESRQLCEEFNIPISGRLEKRGTSWYGGPATTALRIHYAREQGGTNRRDAGGKKRRSSHLGRKKKKKKKEEEC